MINQMVFPTHEAFASLQSLSLRIVPARYGATDMYYMIIPCTPEEAEVWAVDIMVSPFKSFIVDEFDTREHALSFVDKCREHDDKILKYAERGDSYVWGYINNLLET